jgi:hypothetical protein
MGPLRVARAGTAPAARVRRAAMATVARRVRTWEWSFPGGAVFVLAIAGGLASLQ